MLKSGLIILLMATTIQPVRAQLDLPVNNPVQTEEKTGQISFELSLFKIPENKNKSSFVSHFKTYNLKTEADRDQMAEDIKRHIQYYKDNKEIENLDSRKFRISKDIKKSLEYLLNSLKNDMNQEVFDKMYEVADSINLNYKNVNYPDIDITQAPHLAFGALNSRLGKNPSKDISAQSDFEPANSTFWVKPTDVSAVETSVGMGRSKLPDYAYSVFNYKKSKSGYGSHGGFRVDLNGEEYKIRLGGEHRTAPFSARIIHALGFNVLPIDHLKELRMKYDRRLLSEYNLRRSVPFKLTFGPVNLFTYQHSNKLDPFEFIQKAILKNGDVITSAELKSRLGPSFDKYNSQFEALIEEVVYTKVSIEKLDDDNISVGPWDWNSDVHIQHRELRGYGLLAAWLGQYDARTDNTRLYLMKTKSDQYVLRHVISDVGSALGRANPFFAYGIDDIDRMKTVVIKMFRNGDIRSKKFKTLHNNRVFEASTTADARWMFKYIDQLSEKQIKSALAVAGFSAEEQVQAFNKLMLRKENIRSVLQKD